MKITKRKKRKYTYHTQPVPKADVIRAWVYGSGMSIREIEETTGIFRNTIYRMMRGERVRVYTLQKLARAMGVNWQELVARW